MQLFDPNNPNEKKKMIAAAVLGVVALIGRYGFLAGIGETTIARALHRRHSAGEQTAEEEEDTGLSEIVYNGP